MNLLLLAGPRGVASGGAVGRALHSILTLVSGIEVARHVTTSRSALVARENYVVLIGVDSRIAQLERVPVEQLF